MKSAGLDSGDTPLQQGGFSMLDSINSIFGSSGGLIAGLLLALVVLIFGYLVFRMIRQPTFGTGRRGKQARLAITDAINFGGKHKLVLLRRDDIEHLVLIGGPTDLVVESNIRRNAAVRPREPLNADTDISAIAKSPARQEAETPAPAARLRPVANESRTKPERPQFVPRQETADSPDQSNKRSAVSVATPHVRPVAPPPEPKPQTEKAEVPRPAAMTPAAAPKTAAVVGGLVAAPLVAAETSAQDAIKPEQESPFKDEASPMKPAPNIETQPEIAEDPKTLAPRTNVNVLENAATGSTGSVADDMDALLNELNAKR